MQNTRLQTTMSRQAEGRPLDASCAGVRLRRPLAKARARRRLVASAMYDVPVANPALGSRADVATDPTSYRPSRGAALAGHDAWRHGLGPWVPCAHASCIAWQQRHLVERPAALNSNGARRKERSRDCRFPLLPWPCCARELPREARAQRRPGGWPAEMCALQTGGGEKEALGACQSQAA